MAITTGITDAQNTINVPVNANAGDLLVVLVVHNEGGSNLLPTVPLGFSIAAAGWRTALTNLSASVFYKIADGSETTATVLTIGNFSFGTRRLGIIHAPKETGKNWSYTGGDTKNGSSTSHVMGPITTSGTDPCLYALSQSKFSAGGLSSTASVPMTAELWDVSAAGMGAYYYAATGGNLGTTVTMDGATDPAVALAAFHATGAPIAGTVQRNVWDGAAWIRTA